MLSLVLASVLNRAQAAVQYTHTSGTLDVSAIYNTQNIIPTTFFPRSGNQLTFSFQTAALLAPNLVGADVSSLVTSWTASPSVPGDMIGSSVTGSSIYFLTVSTSVSGDVTQWNIGFNGPTVGISTQPVSEAVRSSFDGASLIDQVQFLRANGLNIASVVAPTSRSGTMTTQQLGSDGGGGAAVAEPGTLLLAGSALAAGALARRRRTRFAA